MIISAVPPALNLALGLGLLSSDTVAKEVPFAKFGLRFLLALTNLAEQLLLTKLENTSLSVQGSSLCM